MRFVKKNLQGFTLVELLVVVTIIGILVSIGVVSYQSANQKARDGRRQSDLEQIRIALEVYRSDSATNDYPNLMPDLVSGGYMAALLNDPKSPTYDYAYVVGAGNDTYELCAHSELSSVGDIYCGSSNACVSSCNYRVTNP